MFLKIDNAHLGDVLRQGLEDAARLQAAGKLPRYIMEDLPPTRHNPNNGAFSMEQLMTHLNHCFWMAALVQELEKDSKEVVRASRHDNNGTRKIASSAFGKSDSTISLACR